MSGLLRASAVYTLSNLLPKVGAVFLVPIYVRALSAEQYGTVALLTTLIGFLTMVYHLGMDGSLMRLHFDAAGSARASIYWSATIVTLALAAAVSAVLIVAGPLVFDVIPGDIPFVPLGLLAVGVAFSSSVAYVPSSYFRATRQAVRYAAFHLGSFALTAAAVLFMLLVLGLGTAGVIGGQLVSAVVMLAVAVGVVVGFGPIRLRRESVRALLDVGLPLVPHAISAWALKLLDRWLIGLFIGLPAAGALAAIGAYSFGYQIGSVVTLLVTSFNQAWAPFFYAIAHEAQAPRLYRHMVTIVLAGTFVVAVGLSAISREVVEILARPGYEAAQDVISIVALGSVVYAFYTMFVVALFVAKRTRRLALITFASVVVNVVLNALLIPPLGVSGAAWATVGGYAFFAVATYLHGRGMYPIGVDVVRLSIAGAAGLGVALLARAVQPGDVLAAAALHVGMTALYALGVLALVIGPLRELLATRSELRRSRRGT
jgi:O-antigen/teichoic acid export membrane protein